MLFKALLLCALPLLPTRPLQAAPELVWRFDTGAPIVATPAVADGKIVIGSLDSFIYGIDSKTGTQLWKVETQGPVNGSAAISDGFAYVLSEDAKLYSINVESGKVAWTFNTGYERRFEAKHLHGQFPASQTIPDAWDFFLSTPSIADGKVFFGSSDGNVYALDQHNGKLQWKDQTHNVVHSNPLVAGGTVYIGSMDSRFYAIDEASGRVRWTFKAGLDPDKHNKEGFQGSPALNNGLILVGCRDTHLYALDSRDGSLKWSYSKGVGWISNRPLVADGLVWAGTNPFRAVELASGHLAVDTNRVGIFSNPVQVGSEGVYGTLYGSVIGFDLKTGAVRWEFQTEARQKDALKVLKPDGKINPNAFPTTFGDFEDDYLAMYRRFSLGSVVSTPVVDDGTIYFGSTDGGLYAIKAP